MRVDDRWPVAAASAPTLRGLPGSQLREHVDLGLAQAEIGELGCQVVEHPVHGGLEGGDDGAICHELG